MENMKTKWFKEPSDELTNIIINILRKDDKKSFE